MPEYESLPGVNWSSLKHIATSPLLYRYRVDNPEPRKPAFAWGGAFHVRVLEPEKWDGRYAVYNDTRRGEKWDRWQEENPGVVTFKSHELDGVLAAADAVAAHPAASKLLDGSRTEEPLTWTDPVTGIECKGRIDIYRPDRIGDLKSARSVDPRLFARAAAEHMYHGQLAFYHFGAIAAKRIPPDAPPPFVIAVEKTPPHDVCCYELSLEDLEAGRQLCLDLQAKLLTCIDTDFWPGQAPELLQLQLPAWAPGLTTEEVF